MAGTIVSQTKKSSNNTYYYYKHSYRVKVDACSTGKHRGSGRSKVVTATEYLGTADDIRRKCKEGQKPAEIRTKSFGLECAALAVAKELDLIRIIDNQVSKKRQGLSVGHYIVLAAINRICRPTSRSGIAGWFESSVLPEKMQIDSRLLKTQNFWNAFDKMISQEKLNKRREDKENGKLPENAPILDDRVILDIETDIWRQLLTIHQVQLDPILYDTTNFYSYMDAKTESDLCRFALSKDKKKGRRCTGLALGLTRSDGLPLFHIVYGANTHDSKLFPEAMSILTKRYEGILRHVQNLRVVFDKGNNSKKNLVALDRMILIGSLVPTQHMDLMKKRPTSYTEEKYRGMPVMKVVRPVFDLPAVVVVTYNEKLKRRQEKRFTGRLEQLEKEIREIFEQFKLKDTIKELEKRIAKARRGNAASRFLKIEVSGRRYKTLSLARDSELIQEKMATWGKTVMFSTDPSMPADKVVTEYKKNRNKVEETFRLEKDPSGVPFRPMHCWTDSKIRVYAFVCVIALLIFRMMQYKLKKADLKMSDHLLKMELVDMRESILLYSPTKVVHQINETSAVQKQIASILGLSNYFPESH